MIDTVFPEHRRRVFLARRLLQIAVAIGALIPISAGLAGVFFGTEMIGDLSAPPLSLDSHFRYLSGLLVGIGLCFWTLIPNIEKNTVPFRTLVAIVFIGGLGRLFSILIVGVPDKPMLFGLGMELVVTPLLALAQSAIANPGKK